MLQGDVKLPSTSQMWEDIRLKEAAMAKHYYKSQRHTIQVDYISFMDELAELNGCKPDVGEYQWSHPCVVVFISFQHFAWKAAYTQLTFYLSLLFIQEGPIILSAMFSTPFHLPLSPVCLLV